MSTTGHESEAINVQGLKASLKKGGNIGLYNEAICSTAGGTAAKVTNTTPPSFTLTAGAKILVKFTYAISAENATLQVGSNSAKPIYYKGSALPADLVKAGTSLLLSYDGTSFNIVGDINTDTTYSVMGASGSTHASGLVPDTPSTAGTTKFLREDGTWQEPADYLPLSGGTMANTNKVTNLNADLLDGWSYENFVPSGYVTSGTAGLSSYWGCIWDVTMPDHKFLEYDITFLIQSGYNALAGIVHCELRQAGSGTSRAIGAKLNLIAGNIPLNHVRMYYNNSTGYCALWVNIVKQYGVFSASILKKTERLGEVKSIGSFKGINLSTVQEFPSGASYIEMTAYTSNIPISNNVVNGIGIGTCSTSSGTALEVTLSDYNLVQNGFIAVTFENDVPANATLNVNGKGAKPIIYKGSAIEADTIKADDTVMFCYDGTNYVVTSLGAGGAAPVNPNETVNISLTQIGGNSADLIGATITVTNTDTSQFFTYTWQGTIITMEIATGTNYTVSVETISGYLACADQSYQAEYQTERSVSFQYRGNGVFLEDTNHQLYTSSGWDSSKTINGIVIITGTYNYRFSVTNISANVTYSTEVNELRNYLTSRDPDYQGQLNTDSLANFEKAKNLYTSGHVGYDAQHFLFPDLKTRAYAPTITQMRMVYDNKTEYTACLSAIGSTYNGGWHTTSSLDNTDNLMRWVQMSNFQEANYSSVRAMVFIPVSDYE